jgi:hypothetical protein
VIVYVIAIRYLYVHQDFVTGTVVALLISLAFAYWVHQYINKKLA